MRPRRSTPEDGLSLIVTLDSLASRPPAELTLQDKLAILFSAIRAQADEDPQAWRAAHRYGADTHPSRRPAYTNTYVCQRINDQYRVPIQPGYLGKLRNGAESTRNADILTAIAAFFRVQNVFLLPALTPQTVAAVDKIRNDLLGSLSSPEHQTDLLVQGLKVVGLRDVSPGQVSDEAAQQVVAEALARWALGRKGLHDDRGQPEQ